MLVVSQFIRFVIIGLSNMAISYIVFIASYNFLFMRNIILSQSVSYFSGILWSFYWNKNYTFSCKKMIRNYL